MTYKLRRGKRRIVDSVFGLIRGEAMDLQHYLLRLKPGICSGRQNVSRCSDTNMLHRVTFKSVHFKIKQHSFSVQNIVSITEQDASYGSTAYDGRNERNRFFQSQTDFICLLLRASFDCPLKIY